jgi:Translation machinery associated TMA7
LITGGKAKPLKAPKKEKKDMDEEEVAFKAKQAVGMLELDLVHLKPSTDI